MCCWTRAAVPGRFSPRRSHGSVDVVLDCEPSFGYGHEDAQWEYDGDGYCQVATTNAGLLRLTLAADPRMGTEGRSVQARHRLAQGESCYALLSWADQPLPTNAARMSTCLADTDRFWRGWVDVGQFPDHPWREHLQRSALTLKALTYAPTGALLAAPTTSLPEHPGGTRNWGYRCTWVRDAALTLRALRALGFDAEADDLLAFLGDVLQPSDAVAGERSASPALCRKRPAR